MTGVRIGKVGLADLRTGLSLVPGLGLAWAILAMTAGPAFADVPAPTGTGPGIAAAAPAAMAEPKPKSLVPNDFTVPTAAEAPGFKLVPLGPDLVKVDFEAYMSSIEHLQKTFTRSTAWPHKNISDADAMLDMQAERARFTQRKSFAYAVLTPDGRRERGSVYVQPSAAPGYDAVVKLWVTKADYDAGFDAELYRWVTGWMQTAWPFKSVAYPGRAIEWARWDSLVAANTTSAAVPKR